MFISAKVGRPADQMTMFAEVLTVFRGHRIDCNKYCLRSTAINQTRPSLANNVMTGICLRSENLGRPHLKSVIKNIIDDY